MGGERTSGPATCTAEHVRVEEVAGAVVVSLHRPPVNVLDLPTIRSLHAVLSPLPARRDLRVVVLRSGLERVFSAGVDVRDHAPERAAEMLETFHAVFRLLDELPQVTVAAVDGACLGGGCELAAFCDIVLATPRASFGQPEIDVGCFPPVAAALLPRLVGRAAYEMVLTGAPVGAAEAARIGLVTRVVEDVEEEARRLVARLGEKSGAALALARRALRRSAARAFPEALAEAERIYRQELLATDDAGEGVRAFLEKRKPRWHDR
jgi:cyclohexa-1,5-dienecarbonyl-CoA hydratase